MSESAAETVLRDVLEELGCGTVTLFQIRCLKVYVESMEFSPINALGDPVRAIGLARLRFMSDVWAGTLDRSHVNALEWDRRITARRPQGSAPEIL